MKFVSLEHHDEQLAKLINVHTQALTNLRNRIASAEAKLAGFSDSPTEEGLVASLAAQKELDALETVRKGMSDGGTREAELRDRYVREHKAELVELLAHELAMCASQLGSLSESAGAELPCGHLQSDELSQRHAQSVQRYLDANRALNVFKTDADFRNFDLARTVIDNLGKL